jgi:glutathione reductase (NADPH)
MDRRVDVAVVGSGSAGTEVALTARSHGRSVAVIDERPFGGTCALRGCDPKKVLVDAARAVDWVRRYAELGIVTAPPAISWPHLIRFKRTFTDPVPAKREQDLQQAGVTTLHGQARFEDAQTLAAGTDRVHAEHIVIATGAQEVHVASGDHQLLTSETFMEQDELPQSLIFVGGGYIAFEFAHLAARAGAHVAILHRNEHPLRGFDPDLVEQLVRYTRDIGIELHLNAAVTRVERNTDREIRVFAQCGDREQVFRAQAGVLAAGRAPNLDALALDRGGIERTKKGVKVNGYLQSVSNPHVYAAGDAADAGGLPLTPVAGSTGEIVAENLLNGNSRTTDFRGLVTMVYTIPPMGVVGLTEAQARERGAEIDVHAGDMTAWYSTRHMAGRAAFYKTIVEKGSGKILGAAIFGPHAEEQINVLGLAIRQGIDARSIRDELFAYPTGSSDIQYLLQ